jgi:hypothetical protein
LRPIKGASYSMHMFDVWPCHVFFSAGAITFHQGRTVRLESVWCLTCHLIDVGVVMSMITGRAISLVAQSDQRMLDTLVWVGSNKEVPTLSARLSNSNIWFVHFIYRWISIWNWYNP